MSAEGQKLINGDFTHKSIVSVKQFSRSDVEALIEETDGMAYMVQSRGTSDLLNDLVVANLFYQPSTRTFLSFEAAAKRLGAATISTQGVEYSSISKGETLEDTVKTVEHYADILSIRHPEEGSAERAASVARIPVINAGDGVGEHPTQALLDLYTIKHRLGKIDNLTVAMVGDLRYGRTVHSLARLLGMYNAKLKYISPEELVMPDQVVSELHEQKIAQSFSTELDDALDSDVIYMTRVQQEHFAILEEYEKVEGVYILNPEHLKKVSDEAIVMHPLPRVNEIDKRIDTDRRAAYFDQVESGMYIRMALLAMVVGRSIHKPERPAPIRRTMEPWMNLPGAKS